MSSSWQVLNADALREAALVAEPFPYLIVDNLIRPEVLAEVVESFPRIDGQGNFKTALLSLFARGTRAGFDRHSVREWIAHFAYQRRFAASKNAHAIDRLRRLFASALDYPIPNSPPDFRIQRERFVAPKVDLPKEYLVFVHNASWKTKLWPEAHWAELLRKSVQTGFKVLLPWGNEMEEAR